MGGIALRPVPLGGLVAQEGGPEGMNTSFSRIATIKIFSRFFKGQGQNLARCGGNLN
jgi:hypothetical protein